MLLSMTVQRLGDLEIDQDLLFERRAWAVHRIALPVLCLIVLGGLLGVFGGPGPLSRTEARDPSGRLEVVYQRFARLDSPTELHATIAPALGDGATAMLWVSREFMSEVVVETVTPVPLREVADEHRIIYVFEARPGRAAKVTLRIKPAGAGTLRGEMGLADKPNAALSVRQFIYP